MNQVDKVNKHFSFIGKLWILNFFYTTVSAWLAFWANHLGNWSSEPLTYMAMSSAIVKIVLSFYLCGLYNTKLKEDNIELGL